MSFTNPLNSPAVAVGIASTPILTVGAAEAIGQMFIRFTNLDVNPRQITIYNYDPSAADYPAEAAGPLTTELQGFSIPALSYYDHGPMVLPHNRVVSAKADMAGFINARPHGFKTA